jgi:Tol biopolymer transport system component
LYLAATPQPGVSTIYYTDLRGQAHELWQQKNFVLGWIQPSPDGRYLAIKSDKTIAHDAWLLENF